MSYREDAISGTVLSTNVWFGWEPALLVMGILGDAQEIES
jgi:hypothetical protein